jgi:hypothetical protein
LAAAGQLTASIPAAALMRGVLQSMFIAKLKLIAGAMMVVTALGTTGLVYRAAGQPAPAEPRRAGKPLSEVEALRRENELLKLNLEVVLEKVRAQEAELRALRGPSRTRTGPTAPTPPPRAGSPPPGVGSPPPGVGPANSPPTPPTADPPPPPGGGPRTSPPPPPAANPPPPPADGPRTESRTPRMPDRGGPTSPQTDSRRPNDAPAPERPPYDRPLVPPTETTATEPPPAERRPEPHPGLADLTRPRDAESAPTEEVEDAVRALRKARNDGERRRALDALEKATKKLRRQVNEEGNPRSS